jgi:geranylgeranyl diphosphate synthase type I
MILKIKKQIEKELALYIKNINRIYRLKAISPLLVSSIEEFLKRNGKRIRPSLFVIAYLGFAKKVASGLYRSAISLELLHDFMLVHDDIIDKSLTRRGKPSMHALLNHYLRGYKNLKFDGQDLTIVIGDVMFAMAMEAFLAIREQPQRKEMALKQLCAAAFFTGCGEFLELLEGAKQIQNFSKSAVYRIYDLKTANYTFASPLAIGAILAGAGKKEVAQLFRYGICLGRAFQIKDDIIGIFGQEAKIGKSNLTDLQEGKKTLLVWSAYRMSNKKNRLSIQKLLAKKKVCQADLQFMRQLIIATGALEKTKKEVENLIHQANIILRKLRLRAKYKTLLSSYSEKILTLS